MSKLNISTNLKNQLSLVNQDILYLPITRLIHEHIGVIRSTIQSHSNKSTVPCIRSVINYLYNVRLGHTDIKAPDWTNYRRNDVKSPHKYTKRSEAKRKNATYFVAWLGLVGGLYGTKSHIIHYVAFMAASADVLALAKIEVRLADIPEGTTATFKWRGKPLFVTHRTQEAIDRERATSVSILRDPQHDSERVKRPEWLVVLGICTHLGCVPIPGLGDFNGYYCPCHGSHFDGSGRARKGPAPTNLEIPDYEFVDEILIVG